MSDRPIRDDVHAWIDGRLDLETARRVEAALATDPVAAARASAFRRERDLLAAQLQPRRDEPIPERLRLRTLIKARAAARRRLWTMVAAASVALVIGAGGGWFAGTRVGGEAGGLTNHWDTMAADAVLAHRTYAADVVHAVEVGPDRAYLARWISRRLGHDLPVPDLTAAGYRLVGGRVLPGDADGKASQLLYENASGDRVALYVWAGEKGSSAFRTYSADGVTAVYWVDQGCGYAVTADLGKAAIEPIARLAYDQYDVKPASG
ncbi:anti-sigma factor family protein [Segnochrobactrum spirostomi]|uniref:Anti-sigma factor n=1 Tax=Segnochrobactrum spirostomi TaxID=2608987 RepID=A0A6A7XXL5_9HYPH|nr:anti-sigma factor [Segnochrobactrum spirostomi]MQT11410.1 anti-sigma factor [Segnochrobactrum spirostomi]